MDGTEAPRGAGPVAGVGPEGGRPFETALELTTAAETALRDAAAYRVQYMGKRDAPDHALPYLKLAGGYAELARLHLKLFLETE